MSTCAPAPPTANTTVTRSLPPEGSGLAPNSSRTVEPNTVVNRAAGSSALENLHLQTADVVARKRESGDEDALIGNAVLLEPPHRPTAGREVTDLTLLRIRGNPHAIEI